MRYRKKPVVIEAVRWDGEKFVKPYEGWVSDAVVSGTLHVEDRNLVIATLEGPMPGSPGDWIIRGIRGELYACKPDVFELTYELAGDDTKYDLIRVFDCHTLYDGCLRDLALLYDHRNLGNDCYCDHEVGDEEGREYDEGNPERLAARERVDGALRAAGAGDGELVIVKYWW